VCPDSSTARIPGITTAPGSNGVTFGVIVATSAALSGWLCMNAHSARVIRIVALGNASLPFTLDSPPT